MHAIFQNEYTATLINMAKGIHVLGLVFDFLEWWEQEVDDQEKMPIGHSELKIQLHSR